MHWRLPSGLCCCGEYKRGHLGSRYEVQAGIFFKGTCKNHLVEGLRIAYCPKVTHATAQLCLFILPHQHIAIFDAWFRGKQERLCRRRKAPINFTSFSAYKVEERPLHCNSSLKGSTKYSRHLRWRMAMLSCITPLLPIQSICFRES